MHTPSIAPAFGDQAEIDRLRVVVLRMARRIRSTTPGDISASQLSALGTVFRHGPLGVTELAEREHIRPPSASKIISALETKGYIERRTDPDDRRCQQVSITDPGLELVAAIRAAGRGWLAERLNTLDTDDVTQIASALPALERLLGSYEPGNTDTAPIGDTTS